MEQLVAKDDASVYHASWSELAEVVAAAGGCDALIVDAPYSERTHSAYRDMAEVGRRPIAYKNWCASDVDAFVDAWVPVCKGWIVSLTDHVLARHWESAFERNGLYSFAPIACMEPGSRVRLSGDGPCQWSCFAMVARPKTREAQKWAALPGGYVVPPASGWRGGAAAGGRSGVVGGKPQWLMDRLVEDYSRPGDLICDPCCGAGTTLTAALRTGRRAIGGDINREHAEMAARAVGGMVQRPLFGGAA